jgi:hypothetical protein
MPKKLRVSDSGDQLEIPQEHIIEVSYSKAKQLVKKPREMSEKQRDNIQRLVAMNKKKREEAQALKEASQPPKPPAPTQKIIVKPKRVFKKQNLPPAIEDASTQESDDYDDESEEDEEEEEQQTIAPPPKQPKPRPNRPPQPKPGNNRLQEMEMKLRDIEQKIIKPVQQTKYDNLYSKFFGAK